MTGKKICYYKWISWRMLPNHMFISHIIKWPLPMIKIIRRGITAKVSATYAFSTPTFWLILVRGRSTAGYWATKVTIFSYSVQACRIKDISDTRDDAIWWSFFLSGLTNKMLFSSKENIWKLTLTLSTLMLFISYLNVSWIRLQCAMWSWIQSACSAFVVCLVL